MNQLGDLDLYPEIVSQNEHHIMDREVVGAIGQQSQVNPRAKRWCFTWNNPPEDWKIQIAENRLLKNQIKYLIAEHEIGAQGTPHIQGYVRLEQRLFRNTLYSFLPVYWIVARGSELDNFKYCTKDGHDIFEIGQRLGIVETWYSKVQKLKNMLNDLMNSPWWEFEEKWPVEAFYQYNRLQQYRTNHAKRNKIWNGNLHHKNFWIWGPAGTGKTTWGRSQGDESLNGSDIYVKNVNRWWDGFDGDTTKIVCIEDYPHDGSYLSKYLKTDRFEITGEYKGGSVKIFPGKFILIVTSNYSIDDVFQKDDAEALKRRFHEVLIKDKNDIWLTTRVDKGILTQ
nr:replication-associated protein [Reptile-associated circular DNA molecule]